MAEDADVIVVGGGLAGLVAATEIADAGKRVIVVDQEGEQSLGGQAFWSFGGLFLVDSPEQRRLGIKDSYDLALQDWMGTAGFDRDDDLWPKPLGGSLCRVRRRRKARLAARDGPSHLPGGRLGRARRLRRDGPRQFGAAVSCHLGHRSRASSNRSSAARARRSKSGRLTFKFRHRVDALIITNGTVDGVSGSILEPDRCRARQELFAQDRRRFHAARAGRDRRLRRHRRQSRSGPAELAEASWRAAETHDLRRARTCRRPHDRHHRGRRRAADQPRPDVALCRGHPELVADLAAPRHPHPARPVVDVVRRDRQAAARAAVSRLRHARPARTTSCAPATIIPGSS